MANNKNDAQMSLPELLRQAIRESGGIVPGDEEAPPQSTPSSPPDLRIVKDAEDPPAN